MTEESSKKTNFFKQLIKSIKDFDKYEDFALQKPIDTFKYIAKLIAVFCAIICIVYTYKIISNMNDIYVGLKDKIPEFSYENGKLEIASDDSVIIEEYSEMFGIIIIDTNEESSNIYDKYYDNNIKKYGTGFVFTEENLIIFNSQTDGQLSYKYTDLLTNYNINSFNKQDVINQIEETNIVSISVSIYFMIFIYLYIIYFISIMTDIIILSILVYAISRISRIKFKFAPSFNVAVHSITLPVILNLIYVVINLLTGFEIKYFQVMYNTISCIYIIVAILMIKTDFINRQAELIKIAQEQVKIKEELEKQKEQENKKEKPEEKEESKDENKTTDKPKKDKKKNSESKDPSGEPIGDASISQQKEV